MFWKTGMPPGLSRSWDQASEGLAPTSTPHDLAVLSANRSQELLKPLATAPAGDHHGAVSRRPRHRGADPRLACEGPEPVPHRRFERVRELIAARPRSNLDRAPIEQAQHDRADLASRARTAAEGNRRTRRPAPFKLRPHLVADELSPAAPQARRVRPGGLPAPWRAARIIWERPARWTAPVPPTPRHMNPRHQIGTLLPQMRTAPGARRRPAIRAPLPKPGRAIAHRRPSGSDGIASLWATSISAPRWDPPIAGCKAAGARRRGRKEAAWTGDHEPPAFLSRDRVFLTEIPESACKRGALRDLFEALLPLKRPAIQADCRAFWRVSEGTRTPDRLDHNQELYQLSYAHREISESTSAASRCSA